MLLLSACLTASAQVEFSDMRTLEHSLWEPPAVLVNWQGWAQRDLSIRGSSYTGAGISINSLNLKVPYSAHFNSELPLAVNFFAAPAVQQNTLAYTTKPQGDRGQAGMGIGTKEHYTANLSAFNSGVGGFLEMGKARQIDYEANDLDRYAGGAQLQHFVNDWQIDLIGTRQKKEFGAQGYYGIPANQSAEQTTEDTLIFLGATRGDLNDAYFRASGAWRQFDDTYRTTGVFSDVRSRFGTVALEGRTMEIQNIALNLRGDLENEQVDGTVGSQDRTRGSVLILPEARFERWVLNAGLNSVFQTAESAEFLPQAGIDWFATDNSTLYMAYSETIQQPDYQTLESNALLQLQKTQNSEIGFRQFASAHLDWRIAAFHRRLENASDWVGGTATDLGTLNLAGAESEVSFYPSDALELRAFYQWIYTDNRRTDGFYELDYPEHLLNFSGHWKFTPKFILFAVQTLRLQTDNDARTSRDFGAEASLGLHWFPPIAHSIRLSLLVDNLWGTDFQALPGLKPPERTVFTGITVAW